MYDLGELIKVLRTERGYSQAKLAEKLNKSKSTISKYESNQKMPPLETLINISLLFNVSLDYLAGIEKGKSFPISSLTRKQIEIINTLIIEFRNKKKYPPPCQFD
ncbi:transcriptional regulator [Enterocloster clostridioformis]|uniref:helix-turn-helix domain-containing protein n=1 Tax=Enterocloster clostridioformis TaxID=1531 RepID=UPI00080C68E8|nr:helix-turn-helix transcriptional regulator [Enterocloster clostridioformis]ANU46824.1 transcriptional regulator [Lachnoclostridium sp. YL32]NDO26895.1 helix-turn-helix transcriptional regulator [Enterocloster clostridioformis]OXE62416.1 transcriptional regulator [Enterocloster clostridioformis]QQQ98471.1 helix-turn-helix transcriptional regulator [Enterocloster clostridioformis]